MKQILNDSGFQKTLIHLAEHNQDSLENIQQEAEGYLKELFTDHNPLADALAVQTSQFLLGKAYDKTIDVNAKELKQLSKLMHRHSVAFVMTHKTYIDMLVLGVVLARHGLPLPYIFSGINMSFMGVGQIGRQVGAIFIRRSFKDNLVYKATLRHFIASLVDQKSHFMWAIEGTRSRTGKLVWPKMGILKYILEAELQSKQEVKYVPVSIVYDLIPDVKEMTLQGRGKDKKPESLKWFLNYLRKMSSGNLGRISLRFGDAVEVANVKDSMPSFEEDDKPSYQGTIPLFALELVYSINRITPVTTTSLICISLLSKYSLSKRAIESDVANLMQLIESQKADALVNRGKPIGESVQFALNLLSKAGIVQQLGDSLNAKYVVTNENYLPATYYANMAAHHLYHRAFIELAYLRMAEPSTTDRLLTFWQTIMELRDLFKFEYFYSRKARFSDEIEANLELFDPEWLETFENKKKKVEEVLHRQKVLVSSVSLYTYIEAYRVVAQGLKNHRPEDVFEEDVFVENCMLLGGEMQWQGQIHRIESVSKPFLLNGIRLFKNLNLIPTAGDTKEKEINHFISRLDDIADRINDLQEITLSLKQSALPSVPLERDIVPGSKTADLTQEIMDGESGPHIGAFFDLDRTLIKGFSAKEFFQTRLLSGKITAKEIVAQLAGVLVYTMGNGNFAGLAAISVQGVKGIKEEVFVKVGEEVYIKHLADSIYPESRALVAAHLAKGHSVSIVSAATPYQVNPIARDLGIDEVMCTRMEVVKGKFTGKIIEPACWGEGKAYAGQQLAEKYKLDLSKSYFYTDSAEDLPLLEIVGRPRPMNPDNKLAAIAFQNDWPVYRLNDDEERSGLLNVVRTGLAVGSLFPAAMAGVAFGAMNFSWRDGVNSMMATVGDLGAAMAGIKLVVKGEEHLWSHRPAVFLFNHQSSADLFIVSKLLRKDARAIGKKELQYTPIIGQMMMAAGVIFIDRKNKEKAIEAMKPAVEALKDGISIAIAPEGTRSYDYTLGQFKKGAFHLALEGEVPIVPIVIKNAHDSMPRGSNVFRPALVEAIILPPIPTDNWDVKKLDHHIHEVRQLYLKELGQEDQLPKALQNGKKTKPKKKS